MGGNTTPAQFNILEWGWKLLPFFANIICALLIYWATQINQEVTKLQTEVQGLKEWRAQTIGNGYTAKDHALYADQISNAMQALWLQISDLRQTWLKDMSDIKVSLAGLPTKADIKTLDDRLRDHEQRAETQRKKAE